jgi:hypothetical protein
MKRDPTKKVDPITMLAMAKARERQERRSVSYLIAAAVLVAGLGVIGFFLWPEDPPHVTLAAYDAVVASGQSTVLCARVEPENKDKAPKLGGLELWYQVPASQIAQTRLTDAHGAATLDYEVPKTKASVIEFMVRHQQKDDPKKAARDQGRIFVWPGTASLLVVDIDTALADGVAFLANGDNVAPTLRSGAAATLRALSGRFKVVYFTTAARGPASYARLRRWLRPVPGVQEALPDGPLLGFSVPVETGDEGSAVSRRIEALKQSFSERSVGLTGRGEVAKLFLDAGWKAVVVGGEQAAPAGALVVQAWPDVARELAP